MVLGFWLRQPYWIRYLLYWYVNPERCNIGKASNAIIGYQAANQSSVCHFLASRPLLHICTLQNDMAI
jgi:hypothetical protein